MRHYLDLPEADVARELKLSLSAVKSLNARGLAKLRARLDNTAAAVPGTDAPGLRTTEKPSTTGRSSS